MKPTRGIAVTLLVTAAVISGCSENPALRARYQAEKMFFQSEKAARQARIRPDLTTPAVTRNLHRQYGATLDFCYQAIDSLSPREYPLEHRELSEIAFRAATRLSQFAYIEERFDSCVAVLGHLMNRVHLTGIPNISTYLNLGRALQAAGRWDSALTIYNYSVTNFYPPADSRGEIIVSLFNLPNHIYDVYVRVGDSAAAAAQVGRAEQYYQRLIANYPAGNLAGAGHLNLSSLYERLGRWEDAIAELSQLTDTTGDLSPSAGLRIATLHATQLNRPDLAIEEYDRILQRLVGRDTLRRPMILYNKGLVYLYQKQYGRARQTLVDIKKRYQDFFNRTPTIQYAIARTFELQDNWDRAETEYKYLINNFPTSEQSLSTYLFLIDKYSEQGRALEAERLESRAANKYDELVATYPGTRAEAAALSHKAELYRRRSDWPGAIGLLSEVFDKFPTSEIGFRAAITAALIYRDELNNQAAADSLIQELKKKLTTVDETDNY